MRRRGGDQFDRVSTAVPDLELPPAVFKTCPWQPRELVETGLRQWLRCCAPARRDNQVIGNAVTGADLVSSYNLPAAGGLVALTAGTQPLSTTGPWKIVSGVSYGATSLSLEGTPAAAPTQPNQLLRRGGARGCTSTSSNSTDLILANPLVPFNSTSGPVACTCP